tara:strand:- start:1776 stop:2558 length:783 start_codon:yes stop_codon:yes gene_type:complete
VQQEKKISYSELKVWNECTYKHKLRYIDKVSAFEGNIYTAFGTAMHAVCEDVVQDKTVATYERFLSHFEKELNLLEEQSINENAQMITEMKNQAQPLCQNLLPELISNFGEFEVFSVEEMLMEQISQVEAYGKKFKGFIDLVIRTPDDFYHIIDWKTCSWGWDSRKKTDKMVTYQLAFYKHFFSQKHSIPYSKIKTHFSLLKRTAKKNHIEFFEVPCGKIKINNSLKLLSLALTNIERQVSIKNRLSCKYCEFYKTESCK